MARPASRSPATKKAAPKSTSKGATVTQMLTTPGSGGRRAFVSRATKETRIAAAIDLDGTGKYDIKTGIGFLDHMLEQLRRHSLIDITVAAEGRPAHRLPPHHRGHRHRAGRGLRKALGDRAGIRRYGAAHIPMDETLTARGARRLQPALPDLEGRPSPSPSSATWTPSCSRNGSRPSPRTAGLTLHVENLYGDNNHHIVESCFKALARALRAAVEIDPRQTQAVPTTKGVL